MLRLHFTHNRNITTLMKRICRIGLTAFLCLLLPVTTVSAVGDIDPDYEVECIDKIPCADYDPNSCSADDTGSTSGGGDATGGNSVRATGAEPPYILEMFAIETLKSIAIKRGVPEADAVTEEHVIALVAFMLGEGGDIANRWKFNPLNTGLNAPELIDGGAQADGTQSFKSFDAGVEATARTMVGKNQSRLADKLTDKNSSADQFMEALTFFNRYPGNKFWAAASLPPKTEGYYRQRLALVQQVRANYADIAGTVLGTDAKEMLENITAKEKLKFKPAGDTSSAVDALSGATGGDTGCESNSAGVVAGDIVKTALGLAWPNSDKSHLVLGGDRDGGKSESTPAYQEAQPKYNGSKGLNEFTDCGVFTSTVMIASNADPQYPKRGTGVQKSYVMSNGAKYQIINNPQSTSQLQPGDILIKNGGGIGHTYIYTGPYTGDDGKQYNAASASLALSFGHTPEAETWYQESGYIAARLLVGGEAGSGLGLDGDGSLTKPGGSLTKP
jgi:hypothetical protein